ncbi:MAG: hypothetical protein K2X78_09180 [Burkholderiaceae bacterium]|nr:hypothetical protein [Burkholderiaceae bacterium]
MARNTTPAPASKEPVILEDAIAEDISAANTLALAALEKNERVSALAKQINYQGSTDPAVLENSAHDAIKRIGMAIFELGGYLLLLKEGCVHGEFLAALDRLGVTPRSAQRYMSMCQRFANTTTSSHLEKLGFSKMAELLPLDDDQVDDLVDEGQTGELSLDDVARMSVKQLRAAVRKERQEAAKQKNQVERLTTVNTELHEEVRLVKRLPADKTLAKTKTEAIGLQSETIGLVKGGLRQALLRLNELGDEASKTAFMASLLGSVYVELDALRDEFGLPLASTDATPEWERWAKAQGAIAASDASTAVN